MLPGYIHPVHCMYWLAPGCRIVMWKIQYKWWNGGLGMGSAYELHSNQVCIILSHLVPFITAHGFSGLKSFWNRYLNSPMAVSEAEWTDLAGVSTRARESREAGWLAQLGQVLASALLTTKLAFWWHQLFLKPSEVAILWPYCIASTTEQPVQLNDKVFLTWCDMWLRQNYEIWKNQTEK